jgi:hypothetical protein
MLNSNTTSSLTDNSSSKQFSAARIAEFHAFANGGNAYERLVKSFAPSIWEMDDVKRGLLCLLFGGTIRRGSKKQRQNARKRDLQSASGSNKHARMNANEDDTEPQFGEEEEEDEEEEDEMNAWLCIHISSSIC